MLRAQLEPSLARQRYGQTEPTTRRTLDLHPPARGPRADVPLAPTRPGDGARERGCQGYDALGRPGDDGRWGDAVDPPARERHAGALAPPPVVGERRAPVLLRVDVHAIQRAVAIGAG